MEIEVNERKIDGVPDPEGVKAKLASLMKHGAKTLIAAFVEEREDGWYQVTMQPDRQTLLELRAQGRTPADAFGEHVAEIMAELGDDVSLGSLSAEFESRGDPGAIGHDNSGGWSYGAYQLASLKGSIENFLRFLEKAEPGFSAELVAAGGDAAARSGAAQFKGAWKKLATDHRDRFFKLQHSFIKASYYDLFVNKVKAQINLDVNARSAAAKNVAWSTAVQHGASNNVFKNCLGNQAIPDGPAGDRALITAVYDERAKVDKYFGRVPELHASLKTRFAKEKEKALQMLA